MARHKDTNWTLPDKCQDWGQARTAILMDIRDELKDIAASVRVLRCHNFIRIPRVLDRISANTHRPKRKKKSVT